MKLLCVMPSYWPAFQFGGPIFAVHEMNKELIRLGVDVTVYTTDVGVSGKVPVNQESIVDGVKVTYFSFSRFFEFLGTSGWQFSKELTRALRLNLKAFDIVYIVSVWNYPVAIAAYYCRRFKIPYMISPRGLLYPYSTGRKSWKKLPHYLLITKRALEGAAAIHYTALDEAEKCHAPLGLKNKAVVVPNGIDLSAFAVLPGKEKFKARYPRLKDKKVILFLGRINRKKGIDILLKAYSSLASRNDSVHLLIAGNDEAGYSRTVKGWVKDYRMEERVTFAGEVYGEDKLAAFACSDIFVLPSYSENFGMTVIEAMACRLPVIISNQVGIHRLISKARAGIVIDTEAGQLEKALAQLLDDPVSRAAMGERGRQLVADNFALDKAAGLMLSAYNDMLRGLLVNR